MVDSMLAGDGNQVMVLLLAAGIGLAFISRALQFYSKQAEINPGGPVLGEPAVARLLSRGVPFEQSHSYVDLRFRVEVVSRGAPYETVLDARIAPERVREFAVDDLVWIHVALDTGKIHLDRVVSGDRPARAIAHAREDSPPSDAAFS